METLNENIDYKMINDSWSIDNYYDVQFYNQTKVALANNDVDFMEFISTHSPYIWFLATEQKPIAINYDQVESGRVRYLVTKVKANSPSEEYRLFRRGGQKLGDMIHFIENEPLKEARTREYSCFFRVKNKQELLDISKVYPGKIYYFGKYFNNKYKVCLALSETILGFVDGSDVLISNKGLDKPGEMEAELNFKVFRKQDYLIKYMETPYALNGKYKNVTIQGDRAYKDKYNLT